MPLACVITLLLCFVHGVFAVLPNDLVFTPYSEFPSKNQTELGYQLSYYSIKALTTDKGVYFNHSFSKNIRYGVDFFEQNYVKQIAHHFSYRLGSLFRGSNYHVVFSGGIHYLSNTPIILDNERLHESTLTVSWVPVESPLRFHGTIARKQYSDDVITMGAISFQKYWGLLAIEWDGDYVNLSSQFEINQRIKVRGGITKNIADASELVFKTAIGFVDFDLPILKVSDSSEGVELEDQHIATVDTSAGLIHIQEGLQFYYDGDYRKAQKSYEIAVEFFPHSAVVRERLGSIYYQLGEFEKAQIQWEKANVISPSPRLNKFILQAKEKGESLY